MDTEAKTNVSRIYAELREGCGVFSGNSLSTASRVFSVVITVHLWIGLAGCGPQKVSPFEVTPHKSAPLPQPFAVAPPSISAPAAEPAGPSEADLIFPTRAGDVWEMKAGYPGESHKLEIRSLGEQRRGGVKAFFLATSLDGKPAALQGYTVDEKGINLVASGDDGMDRIEPPMTVIQLPLKSGSTWTWRGRFIFQDGSDDGSAVYTLTGPEKVKTAAGDFQAYRLDGTITHEDSDGIRITTNSQWFAPRIGLIKQLTIMTGEQDRTAQLVKYRIIP